MAKMMKWLWVIIAVLAGVGGIVHVGTSYNLFLLLPIFGSWANLVQLLAGASGVALAVKYFMKKK